VIRVPGDKAEGAVERRYRQAPAERWSEQGYVLQCVLQLSSIVKHNCFLQIGGMIDKGSFENANTKPARTRHCG
jgi:hypothetical protein